MTKSIGGGVWFMIKWFDARFLFAATIAAILALSASVKAAPYYWDGTETGANADGGNGIWNTSSLNWDTALSGGAETNWVNANNDTAVFAGTAGTVSLGTGITVGGLQFDTAAYTLTDNTLTFGTSGNIVVNQDATINSAIAAATGTNITKTGSGTLTLGGNNTYAGNTTISAGTLKVGSATAISANSALTVSSTGVFDLNGNSATVASVGAGSSTAMITNSAAGSGTNTLTVATFTANLAPLIVDGAAQKTALVVGGGQSVPWLANANNTFSGGLTISSSSGQTRLYQLSALATTLNGDGSIKSSNLGAGPVIIGSTTGGAQLAITTANQSIYNPLVFNAASYFEPASGRAAFRADSAGNKLYGQLTANASPVSFSSAGSGSVIALGQITGAYGLWLRTSAITLTLSNITANANNYQGTTTIEPSTVLALGKTEQIPNGASAGNVTNNGTFNMGGFSETINGLSGTGTVDGVSGNPTLTVGDNNATGVSNTFSGVIKNTLGTLSLTKIGTGTLALSGTNSFAGVVTINASGGTLQISGAGQLGNGSYATNIAIGSSATFDYSSSASQTLSGAISGAGALNKGSSGILTLSGSNTFAGATTISAGTLMAGSSTAISTNSVVNVNSTGVFDLNGFNSTVTNLGAGSATAMITNSAAGSGTNTLTINRFNVNLAPLIADGATAKTALVVSDLSDTPKFMNANNTFSGGLTLAANAGGNTRIYQDNVSTTTNGDGSIQKSTFGKGTINIGTTGSTVNAQLVITSASQLIYNPIVFNAAGYADGGRAAIRADGGGLLLYGQLTAGASDINISAQGSSGVTAFRQLTSSGANGLTLKTPGNGTGTLTLTLSNTTANANNYQGNTTLQSLTTLALGAADQIPNGASAGNVTNNGTFNLGGYSEIINGLSGNGTVDGVSGSPTLTVGDNNATGVTNTFSGVIKGPLSLTKIGNGTLTLSGTNTYSGLTTVSAGELVGTSGGSCSNSIVTVAAGATNGVSILTANGQWVCSGLTNSSGYLDINYGAIGLSTTTAPLLINGSLDLSGTIILRSTAGIGIGQYPLVKYTGTLSGTPPVTVTLPAGVSGSLSNNTANLSLDLVVTTPSAVYWAVGSGNWNINTSLNWKDTPSAGVTNAYYVNGEAVTFDDSASGSSPILVTNAVAVSPASVVVTNATKNYQISGNAIAGNNVTLTKSGTGMLTLSGTNTFGGAIQVNNGFLVFANTNAKPAAVTATTAAAGSIGLGVGSVSGDYSDVDVATLFSNTLVGFNLATGSGVALDTTAGNFTNTTGLAAARALTKLGGNTLTLSGTNTYSGATAISNGTLKAGSTTGLSSNSAFSVAAGATLDLGGYNNTISNLSTATGTITDSSGAGLGGTLRILTAMPTGPSLQLFTGSMGLQFYGGNTVNAILNNAGSTYSGGTILGNGSGTINTRVLLSGTVGTGSPGSVTSGIFGIGAITIGAAVTDRSQFYFSGATTVNNAFVVNSAAGLTGPEVGAFRSESTGVVLAGAISANLADATFNTVNNLGQTITVSGAISGNSGVRVTSQTTFDGHIGGLTVTLNNAGNSYAGNTTVDGNGNAALTLGAPDQIPNGASKGNLIVSNATFYLGGFSETINGLSGSGIVDGVSGNPTLTVGDNNATGVSNTFSGVIKGPLSLTKIGNGTLTLSGTNTYSGLTTVSAGALVGASGGSCSNSIVTVAAGATNGVSILTANGQWVCAGLTNSAGYLDINYGAIGLSTTTAPLLINGSLDLSGTIIVRSTAGIGVGQYPLVKYTGTLSGTPPTTVTLPAGVSGSLSNNTANLSLDLVVTTASAVYWAVGSGNWNINTSLNWKDTPSAGVTNAYYVDGEAVTFDDSASGSSPILVTNAVAVSPASVVVTNATKNYHISGSAIAGNATLTKSGTGTLTLSGANTFGGAMQVNGGILVFANTGAKPAGTATTAVAGSIGLGVGAVSGDYSDADVAALFSNILPGFSLATGSGVVLDTTAGNFTQTTGLTTNRALTKLGGNILTLSGSNTYSGATTISAGTLKAGSTTGLSSNSAFSVAAGAILDLGGFSNTISSLSTATGTITNSTGSATLRIRTMGSTAQLFTGNLGLQFAANAQDIDLTNAGNTFSGGTTLGLGAGVNTRILLIGRTLGVGGPGTLTSGQFGTGAITLGVNATDYSQIMFASASTINNAIVVNSARGNSDAAGTFRVDSIGNLIAGTINANLAAATFRNGGGSGAISLTGAISGTGGLTLSASGGTSLGVTLTSAANTNSYAGDTTISSVKETLTLGAANQIPNGVSKGNLIVTLGAFIMGGNSETINGLSGTGTVDGFSGTPTLTVGDNDATGAANTFSGVIKNTGGTLALTKIGNGTLTLSGTNTYGGNTTISAGKLQVVVGGSCSNSTVVLANATATNSVSVTDISKSWTCSNLTASAAGVMEFSFGALTPSASVSPLNIRNGADFTATPTVSVLVNSGLAAGTYPLMRWGSSSGTVPTTANLAVSTLASGTAASLSVSGGNTLNLVIVEVIGSVYKIR